MPVTGAVTSDRGPLRMLAPIWAALNSNEDRVWGQEASHMPDPFAPARASTSILITTPKIGGHVEETNHGLHPLAATWKPNLASQKCRPMGGTRHRDALNRPSEPCLVARCQPKGAGLGSKHLSAT